MTTSLLALNAILMLGVVVAIVGLLTWAILTQHRDHRRTAVSGERSVRAVRPRARAGSQPHRRPVTGGV